jgi:hypothetical protein
MGKGERCIHYKKKQGKRKKICIMKMLKVLRDYWLKPRPRPFEEK